MKHITIKQDTFDIASRLKQIDNNYILKFNLEQKRYEVFYKEAGERKVLQLVLPYKELDQRTINYVNKTRVQNIKKLVSEMEEQNKKLQTNAQNKMYDEATTKLNEMGKYITRKADNYNINFDNSYKTKWV